MERAAGYWLAGPEFQVRKMKGALEVDGCASLPLSVRLRVKIIQLMLYIAHYNLKKETVSESRDPGAQGRSVERGGSKVCISKQGSLPCGFLQGVTSAASQCCP